MAVEVTPPMQALWPAVWLLLRLRAQILVNNFRRGSRREKIGTGVIALVLIVVVAGVFYMSWSMLGVLPSIRDVIGSLPESDPDRQNIGELLQQLQDSLPALVISFAFFSVLLTSFGVLLQVMYLSNDMDFLLSKPLPPRAVFIAKLLQAVLPNFGLICMFSLPVLFGLGLSKGYHFLYYLLAIVLLSALALAAAGISSLLVMFIVRVFPARRVAEVLGFLGGIMSLLCAQSGQIAAWSAESSEQSERMLQSLRYADSPWSPLAWAGRGLAGVGREEWTYGLSLTMGAVALALGAFAFALVIAERMYYTGWAGLQNRSRRKKERSQEQPGATRVGWRVTAARLFEHLFPPAVRAILLKDVLVLRRDLRNLSQLVTPLVVAVIYALLLLRASQGDSSAAQPEEQELPVWVLEALESIAPYLRIGIPLFIGWMLLSRLAGIGFAHEGRSYWLIKSAPVRANQVTIAKFLVAYLPVLVLCWSFVLATWMIRLRDPTALLYSMLVTAASLAGNAGLNLSFGILGTNLSWDDPRQMQRPLSGCLAVIASMLYLPASWLLFFGPAIGLVLAGLPRVLGEAIGLVLGGTFSLVWLWVPLGLLRKRVERLGE